MEVHRCRFVPYPPSTINVVAFSHFRTKDHKTAPPRLAVGRANGDIEIWNPLNGSWHQETVIRGGLDRSVDGLIWIQDPTEQDAYGKTIVGKSRLFSIGYTTTVTEWDLMNGQPLRQASGNHGEIWCLAAQPPFTRAQKEAFSSSTGQYEGQSLVTGCTDGALVLYSTKDDDLQLQRVLVRPSAKKAKIISVTFQDRNIVVAGCTDSAIRVYDIRNGSNLRTMSFGAGPKGGPKEIIVWSVKVLSSGHIVSGDSTGELRIWDGKTYTLMQRLKGHKQDILSLATSVDGTTIVSGGMDRRTVVYKRVDKKKGRWAEIGHRRYHTHDVKTMASFEYRGMSVVVSGGPDASPTVLPLRQFGMENQRALPFLPQNPTIQSAPRKRLMMSFWDREVHIWRLNGRSESTTISEPDSDQDRKLVAKILIKGEANITSAALSADGNLLAAATTTEVKLFQLKQRKVAEGGGLKISKVAVPSSFSSGARHVQFSPDEKWLCIVRPNSRTVLARLLAYKSSTSIHPQLSKLSRLDRQIEKHVLLGGLGAYDRTITQVAFSSDSRILAVSDLSGYIDTFVLSGQEDVTQAPPLDIDDAASPSDSSDSEGPDSEDGEAKTKLVSGQHWRRNPSAASLPKVSSAPTVLSFRPSTSPPLTNGTHAITTRHKLNPIPHDLPEGEDRLLVVTATGDIFEFEVLKGALSPWSRRNPTADFPEDFRKIRDLARGSIWDVSAQKERVWIYGDSWLWMFDLSRDFPHTQASEDANSKKRKRGKDGAGSMIPDKELGTGISRTMQRIVHEEAFEVKNVPFHDQDAMEEDSEADESMAMVRLRRGNDKEVVTNGDEMSDKGRQWWNTFKYRPILGMCVIGEQGSGAPGPEVAIVERPIWEVDLGPRYVGDQEWERGGL